MIRFCITPFAVLALVTFTYPGYAQDVSDFQPSATNVWGNWNC